MPIEIPDSVNEKSTCLLKFTATDYDGSGIANSNIATATLTLTKTGTDTIINSRQNVDVKSMFNAQGEFSFELEVADNTIQTTKSVPWEEHSVTIQITTNDGVAVTEEITYKVINLKMIS